MGLLKLPKIYMVVFDGLFRIFFGISTTGTEYGVQTLYKHTSSQACKYMPPGFSFLGMKDKALQGLCHIPFALTSAEPIHDSPQGVDYYHGVHACPPERAG